MKEQKYATQIFNVEQGTFPQSSLITLCKEEPHTVLKKIGRGYYLARYKTFSFGCSFLQYTSGHNGWKSWSSDDGLGIDPICPTPDHLLNLLNVPYSYPGLKFSITAEIDESIDALVASNRLRYRRQEEISEDELVHNLRYDIESNLRTYLRIESERRERNERTDKENARSPPTHISLREALAADPKNYHLRNIEEVIMSLAEQHREEFLKLEGEIRRNKGE
jgi:hypothetical protein